MQKSLSEGTIDNKWQKANDRMRDWEQILYMLELCIFRDNNSV
jgi:hypothetical protein